MFINVALANYRERIVAQTKCSTWVKAASGSRFAVLEATYKKRQKPRPGIHNVPRNQNLIDQCRSKKQNVYNRSKGLGTEEAELRSLVIRWRDIAVH
jgi:hypothetical protein